MAFWNRKRDWEDDYDDDYLRGRGLGPGRRRPVLRYLGHGLLLLLLGGAFTFGVGLVAGPTMAEKLLTSLATPVGVTWLLLIGLVYFSLLHRQAFAAWTGFIAWLVLTAGGNQLTSNYLAGQLEAPFVAINPFADTGPPYELVVLLGGGTNTNLAGNSQLTASGDRLAVAARMVHAGRVERVICSGSQASPEARADRNPGEEAADILVGLGVPRDRLLVMRGKNTYEEMANLKTWLDEHPTTGRIGVISSAWHLQRVLALAQARGLNLDPLPANFLSGEFRPSPQLIVPGSLQLHVNAKMCKEILARWIGR